MNRIDLSDKVKKILKHLNHKDPVRREAVLKKLAELESAQDFSRYKNLRYDFKEYKRVHIDTHFVMIFRLEGRIVKIEDIQHHDKIYRH
jgi:mRNA-degrading endonuclease RelE of RelBE toxin-antitoxin system